MGGEGRRPRKNDLWGGGRNFVLFVYLRCWISTLQRSHFVSGEGGIFAPTFRGDKKMSSGNQTFETSKDTFVPFKEFKNGAFLEGIGAVNLRRNV